ncbi:MAG: M28 family peptidase [Euryarchaeota archaeon]|nr:M28 family peptidase [Euryarchaeota archaeon]
MARDMAVNGKTHASSLILGALVVLSGCVSTQPIATSSTLADAELSPAELMALLESATPPAVDAKRSVDWLIRFTDAYGPRVTGSAVEAQATEHIISELKAMGYTVELRNYAVAGLTAQTGSKFPLGPLRAIVAHIPGTTDPNHWVAWGGHYDSKAAWRQQVIDETLPEAQRVVENRSANWTMYRYGVTLKGAYDNGSGTMISLELARLLKSVPTEKTRAVILFNGEEEGLLASQAFVADIKDDPFVIDTYIGFDMVGINWPSTAGCMCIYSGASTADVFNPLQRAITVDMLGYPEGESAVQILNFSTRNSDERNFDRVNIPVMRWSGMRLASDYNAYHAPDDTMENIYTVAGGRGMFEAGVEKVLTSTYYTVLALDKLEIEYERTD